MVNVTIHMAYIRIRHGYTSKQCMDWDVTPLVTRTVKACRFGSALCWIIEIRDPEVQILADCLTTSSYGISRKLAELFVGELM